MRADWNLFSIPVKLFSGSLDLRIYQHMLYLYVCMYVCMYITNCV